MNILIWIQIPYFHSNINELVSNIALCFNRLLIDLKRFHVFRTCFKTSHSSASQDTYGEASKPLARLELWPQSSLPLQSSTISSFSGRILVVAAYAPYYTPLPLFSNPSPFSLESFPLLSWTLSTSFLAPFPLSEESVPPFGHALTSLQFPFFALPFTGMPRVAFSARLLALAFLVYCF